MARRNVYAVDYRIVMAGEVRHAFVIASSKVEAYMEAVYVEIPKKEGVPPYNAWVKNVTYQNGNVHEFNYAAECAPF